MDFQYSLLIFLFLALDAAAFLPSPSQPFLVSSHHQNHHQNHHHHHQEGRYWRRQSPLSAAAENDEDENENDETANVNPGREKSRMEDFIAEYLEKDGGDVVGKDGPPKVETSESSSSSSTSTLTSANIHESTHLVAIPMEFCHELLIELESVQRAILYHCPILVDACILPAMTRMPLLYVQAKDRNSARVTSILADTVKELVQKHLFQTPEQQQQQQQYEEEGDAEDILYYTADDLNDEGIKPVTVTFKTLEIDGANNNVLNTVGIARDRGTKQLGAFIQDLQSSLQAKGYQTVVPPDPNEDATTAGFRPRIPFMQLPKEFDDNLSKFKSGEKEISDEDFEFLSSENGGNGISPIFWCQWWDDVFGTNVRLREVGIYPRTPPELSHDLFCLPHETIPLPDGSAVMHSAEETFQKYQDERMEEERERQYQERAGKKASVDPNERPDMLMTKTRDRLEKLYVNSAGSQSVDEFVEAELEKDADLAREQVVLEETKVEEKVLQDEVIDEEAILENAANQAKQSTEASPDDFIDDWMKDRMRKVVDSRESAKAKIQQKKDMPPIEENPVFHKYKDGTLVPKNQRPKKKVERKMDPYPSRDHFTGIWRVVTSPTGFPAEESGDDKSENLVLRVDGTTAGGPILDMESRQKAAGGTWKMLVDEDGNVRLRIRLVLPPKKERILVMDGEVNRMNVGTDIPMASKSFGVPDLEAKLKKADEDMQDLMHCGGEVFLEDATTKTNREDIGTFSLMKLQSPKDPSEYSITTPRPTRIQD
jgi:hypothetical protein